MAVSHALELIWLFMTCINLEIHMSFVKCGNQRTLMENVLPELIAHFDPDPNLLGIVSHGVRVQFPVMMLFIWGSMDPLVTSFMALSGQLHGQKLRMQFPPFRYHFL